MREYSAWAAGYGKCRIGLPGKRESMQQQEKQTKSKKSKGGPVDISKIKPEEMIKYEIAKELGLYDKVISNGWRSLTAKESGRIGGIMTRRKKEEQKKRGDCL